jgi:hypothetical protein
MAIEINLHERQLQAFYSLATEILYGGAAGGGKSHLMRSAAILWCSEIAGLQIYLFRRIREDLIKNHLEGPQGFRAMLAPWVHEGFIEIVGDEIRFWNGSKIYLCHCKDEKDRYKYQGAEIHVLMIDELTHFTEVIYRFLRNRVRAVGIKPPDKYKGLFPKIICGANPGNIGHQFVKQMFIDGVEPMKLIKQPRNEGGMLRQFIPARLEDNPSMAEHDPDYEMRLEGLGSEALVKAMRWGDWNVIEGAFFDCWDSVKHVLRPFEIPADWTRFRAMDWGSAKPFSVGWYAVVPDDYRHQERVIPRGSLIRYREWYGCRDGEANTGLKLTVEEVAHGIATREAGEKISYGVADPAMFAEDGGPSMIERMQRAANIFFRRADNKRVARGGAMGGWDMVRQRLLGEAGVPRFYVFSTNVHFIRTVPLLQHDELRPEDVNTDQEDHAADEGRYACMSRPWVSERNVTNKPRFDAWADAFEQETANTWKTL